MKLKAVEIVTIVLLLQILVLSAPQMVWSEGKQKEEKSLSAEIQLIQESRAALSEERQLLEKQAERHFLSIDNLLNRVIWGLGILVAGVLALLTWMFGSTRKELRNTINELFEREAKTLIVEEANQLRLKYQELKSQVDDLAAYKGRQVTWVLPEDNMNNQPELEALYAMGLKNIQMVTPAAEEVFEVGEPDLVIYTYDGTEKGKKLLHLIVNRLKAETPPIFLIIYTYNPDGAEIWIDEQAKKEILTGFHWFVPANFPSQLVLQTQLLIRRNRSIFSGGINGKL